MNNKAPAHRKSIFDNTTFTIVFSVLIAVLGWFIISFRINTSGERTISGVKVSLSQNSSAYQNLGLDIIDRSDRFVDITVTGDRNVIGSLTPSDFIVTPNYSRVLEAGTYELELSAQKSDPLLNFEIVSIHSPTIELSFDNAISRRFSVALEMVGHSAAEGYVIGTIVSSPSEITVTGPENEIEGISRVVASYEVDEELNEPLRVTCPIKLLDASGNEITSGTLRTDVGEVDVTIPVYKRGLLELDIGFTNVPDGFDVSSLEYVMSHTAINVAGLDKVIDNMTERVIGYVDLASFKVGESYTFEVNLPSGLVNLDNIETVAVTFPRSDLSTKKVNVSDIRVENAPSNFDITVITPVINDVTVIGPAEDIEQLLAGSVVAVVDMSATSVESGSYNVPVSFNVTSNSTTWVAGSYSVTIEVEPN